jgi:AraC-like DNA-binding protein
MNPLQLRSTTRTGPSAAASRSSDAARASAPTMPASIVMSPVSLKVKVIFIIEAGVDNGPASDSRGLPAPARPANPRHHWYRVVARRLAEALRGDGIDELLAVAALAATVVEQEADGPAAARRAAMLLDAAQIAPGTALAPGPRITLETAAEEILRGDAGTPGAVAARLRDVLREIALGRRHEMGTPALQAAVPVYVADHLHEGARLTDLARRLGYSPSHCSALVRRATGERFSVLRRRMQLERAIGLLRGGASVKEAALTAGFSEPAYFSRVFTRRFGVPPSRWRDVLG